MPDTKSSNKADQLYKDIQQVKKEVSAKNADVTALNDNVKLLEGVYASTKTALERAKKNLESATSDVKAAQEQVAAVEKKLADFQERIQQNEINVAAKNAQVVGFKPTADANEDQKTLAKLGSELLALQGTDEALKKQRDAVQAELKKKQRLVSDNNENLKMEKVAVDNAQAENDIAQKDLEKKQAELKALSNPKQTLDWLSNQQFQAAAKLAALHADTKKNVSVVLEGTQIPKTQEEFDKKIKFWTEKVTNQDIGGDSNLTKIKFSREPFGVSTTGGSVKDAQAVAAAASLMANDKSIGVKSLTISNGTKEQRHAIAKDLLQAGHSKVQLSTEKDTGYTKSDDVYNIIFRERQKLKDSTDNHELYKAVGVPGLSKDATPTTLQSTLVAALTPAQVAEMYEKAEKAGDTVSKAKILEQLADHLKGKKVSEWQKYADCLGDNVQARQNLANAYKAGQGKLQGWVTNVSKNAELIKGAASVIPPVLAPT